MPGIIVSRPIFNSLFKLAHEEGLSINAFLTRLLESAGPDAVKQAVAGRPVTSDSNPTVLNASGMPNIAGAEQHTVEMGVSPDVSQQPVRPIEYDEELESAGVGRSGMTSEAGEPTPGRRIGNSVWDKVVSMEGRRFATSRGKKFSYKVTGEYIVVRDSQARIPRSQFDKAQKMWPVTGPSRLVGVYAPSVVWAVLKEVTEAQEPALA